MIRTVMVKTPNAVEYQVRQTDRGIDVAVVADGALDHAALTSALEHSLRAAGLDDPCGAGCTGLPASPATRRPARPGASSPGEHTREAPCPT